MESGKENEQRRGQKTVIGLTGGIGSGKSTVSAYLKEKGCDIIDGDLIAREIVMPGMPALNEIYQEFGREMLFADGTLDRKRLGSVVFADPAALSKLNEITGRRIREEIRRRLDQCKRGIQVIDAAMLLESGLQQWTDQVWIVDAPDEVRLRRVMQRDGLERRQVENRMRAQMTREERLDQKAVFIDNGGSVEQTKRQVDRLLEGL